MQNRKERTKESIIKQCCAGKITAKDAALRLKLTIRQVENLKKKCREGISLLHGNCGRVSAKAMEVQTKQKVLEEYRAIEGLRMNYTHFHEYLIKKNVAISYTAMRKILVEEGFKSPKTRRAKKDRHPSRERREKFGELLQADATPYDWFGTGKKYALHGFIDDATGKITGLHISENECMDGYLEVTRQTLETYGTPESIYADGLSIFFPKHKQEELTVEEQLTGVYTKKTQFGTICDTLGITLIHARSSQAKGRVERLWETLQSRLPVEFALHGIDTPEAANRFLREEYINAFNERFAVNRETMSCFVALPKAINLDSLLVCYYKIVITMWLSAARYPSKLLRLQ
jgi:transposase